MSPAAERPDVSVQEVLRDLHDTPPDYAELGPDSCLERAEFLFETWLPILERNNEVAQLFEAGESPENAARWRAASLLVGRHFASALLHGEPSTRQGRTRGDWNPFLFSLHEALLTSEFGHDATVERRLLVEYLKGIWNCYLMELLGSAGLGMTPVGWASSSSGKSTPCRGRHSPAALRSTSHLQRS